MGNSANKSIATEEELAKLREYGVTEKDLQEMRTQFMAIDEDGDFLLEKKELQKAMGMIGSGEFGLFCDRIITAFVLDKNSSGKVTFKEYVTAKTILKRGTLNDRFEFAFRILNLQGHDRLDKFQFAFVVQTMYHIISKHVCKYRKDENNSSDGKRFIRKTESNASNLQAIPDIMTYRRLSDLDPQEQEIFRTLSRLAETEPSPTVNTVDEFARLLESGENKKLIDVCDKLGNTLLMLSSASGNWAIVKLLLEKGANVNLQDKNGWTCLHYACLGNSEYIVRLLLDKPLIDVNAMNADRSNCLHYIAKNLNFTKQIGEIVAILEAKGMDFNAVNVNGETALHNCAFKCNYPVACVLVKKVDVNLKNAQGETALHWACRMCHQDMVQLLLDNSADILIKGSSGTPLEVAQSSGKNQPLIDMLQKQTELRTKPKEQPKEQPQVKTAASKLSESSKSSTDRKLAESKQRNNTAHGSLTPSRGLSSGKLRRSYSASALQKAMNAAINDDDDDPLNTTPDNSPQPEHLNNNHAAVDLTPKKEDSNGRIFDDPSSLTPPGTPSSDKSEKRMRRQSRRLSYDDDDVLKEKVEKQLPRSQFSTLRGNIYKDFDENSGQPEPEDEYYSTLPPPDDFVKAVFDLFDTDKDGLISLQDFKRGALLFPNLLKSLGVFRVREDLNQIAQDTDLQLDEETMNILLGKNWNTKSISFGGPSLQWNFVLTFMKGVSVALYHCHQLARVSHHLKQTEFRNFYTFQLANEANNTTASFKDYSPMAFRHIRRRFGLYEQDYAQSLGLEQILGNFLIGNLSTFAPLASNSRSGALFFWSPDNKYIIKTISHEEQIFLWRILPDYYRHIMQYSNTLLPRFYGLHKITFDATTKYYFIVMENVFKSSLAIHDIYDLKGSKVNRTGEGSSILKDLDLKDKKIHLGSKKAEFLNQLRRDVRFLEHLEIMDYSLLLGIHYTDRQGQATKPSLANTRSVGSSENLTAPSTPQPDNTTSRPLTHSGSSDSPGVKTIRKRDKLASLFNRIISRTNTADNTSGGSSPSSLKNSQSSDNDNKQDLTDSTASSDTSILGSSNSNSAENSPTPNLLSASSSGSTSYSNLQKINLSAENLISGTRPRSNSTTAQPKTSMFQTFEGGIRAEVSDDSPGNEIYFVGIIDTLIRYATKKKAEHNTKKVIYNADDISVVPPSKYAQRFQEFITSIVD